MLLVAFHKRWEREDSALCIVVSPLKFESRMARSFLHIPFTIQ